MRNRLLPSAVTVAIALMAGCSDNQVPGSGGGFLGGGALNVKTTGLTHIKNDGTTETSIKVTWSGLPSGTKDVDLNRIVDGGRMNLIQTFKKGESGYVDRSVIAGKTYQYAVAPFDDQGRPKVESVKSAEIRLAPPSELGATTITSPAVDTFINRSEVPSFAWDPVAGADLYWVQVRDRRDGKLIYGALTKNTTLDFGTASPVSVPAALADTLQTARGGFTNGEQYSLMISSLAVEPKGSDLNGLRTMAIRDSQTLTLAVR